MRQERLLNMRHHNTGWKSPSRVTRLNFPHEVMYDWRLTGDGITLMKSDCSHLVSVRIRIPDILVL